MKYLLTGLGFISTHVALYLSEVGEDVTVTYKSLNPVKEEYISLLKGKVKVVNVDPLSEEVTKLISRHDIVANFIGEISGGEDKLRLANVEIPSRLARDAFDQNKTFIHLSGATSTGETGVNVKEEAEHCKDSKASTPFEKSKCEGEKEIMRLALEKDGNLAILRPTLVYGRYAAHVQFVTMYKLVKARVVPELGLRMATVNAWTLGRAVHTLGKVSPKRVYLYASECGSVAVSRFFELMSEEVGKGIRLPIPTWLAKAVLPKDIRNLLRYSGTTYDCSAFKEVVGDMKFDEEEVRSNARFLKYLEEKDKLIPT
ncbi:NAD-dependent epimerase/dehydratase [Metallosphaera sedula]|uniref:NAD-dependent epimerase/dehydratase n=3 Tax=Metallosphaera TaxID=41980 RepID=A4YDV9_METS5|nr:MULTISPECIES: NAD-dependent epimerase/dehydratase family protein [Metallosphaera]ABP94611.1 NAD-dependent epimerase/dehydratase [Metallosphaera sedula DSM 5348]AIM26598.1 NAD-dependent epimerase/dehydratase [Metallosphaera sedula]AKV73579.1 epimerase [Metallosphaera sedula]AKV75820.1 epimerase [Metallosphaera sedula]AKV78069.1 epimerase [Metallosphaera sedula]